MKKLYVWVDNALSTQGVMDAVVYDDLTDARRAADYQWDHLTDREKKKRDEFCIYEMTVPDTCTADTFNNDCTGDEWYCFEYVTGTVDDYKEVIR